MLFLIQTLMTQIFFTNNTIKYFADFANDSDFKIIKDKNS